MDDKERALRKEKFLEYFRQLPVQKLAAGFAGVVEETIINWKKEDEEFSNQIATAKSNWALKKTKRIGGAWLLERLMNEHFAEKKKLDVEGELTIVVKKYNEQETPKDAD